MSIFNKNGVIKINSVNEILQLEDGSRWVPIVIHNVKKGANMFTTSDDFTKYVYHNSECWANFPVIENVTRPSANYEFLVLQQAKGSENLTTYRWAQTVSPLTATWAQVNPSSGNITHYDGTSYGGMYILNGAVYMCFANGNNGNWFGCAHKSLLGGTAGTDGYIPGYNGVQVSGWQNVYIRVSKIYASLRSDVSVVGEFYEI